MYFRIVLLKISQCSQENPCVGVLFYKIYRLGVLLWNWQIFMNTVFTEHIRWLLLEISHELSLYCIWEQWMVSFRGTYWLPSVYFIFLRVFPFFFSCFFFFCVCVWILLLFGFEASLSILKQNSGVVPRFRSGFSRSELLQPYLVQFWKS